MESEIYEWLLSNCNNVIPENESESVCRTPITLIDYILMLSTKGLEISYQQLTNCFNNMKSNDNNNTTISNDNNKRHYNFEENQYILFGLNKNQFQILENSLSLSNIDFTNNNNNIIYTHNITSDIESDTFKFDCSMALIIKNNKYHLKIKNNQQLNNNNNNNSKSVSNKKIKLEITSNNDSSTKVNNDDKISLLFFKVWRNIVTRNQISFHVKLFSAHKGCVISLAIKELGPNSNSTYKYKNYIDILRLNCQQQTFDYGSSGDDSSDEESSDEESSKEEEKEKVKEQQENSNLIIIKPNLIPSNVSTIHIDSRMKKLQFEIGSIPESTTSIHINSFIDQVFTKGIFPDSVTTINFNYGYSQSLSGDWLPSSIKSLYLGDFHASILPGQLPDSLTELSLTDEYTGTISSGSLSNTLIESSLKYKFNSNGNTKSIMKFPREQGKSRYSETEILIPQTTDTLIFDSLFNQNIKIGDIPRNVKSIYFGSNFNGDIEVGSLSSSITNLSFSCDFNKQLQCNTLPSNLEILDIGSFNQPLLPNVFPLTLKSITFSEFTQCIPDGYFINHNSLTYLNVGNEFSGNINLGTLPNSLTHLKYPRFNSSLSLLNLPSLIKILELLDFNQIIKPNQLPQSLEILHLTNDQFNTPLSDDDGSLPKSLHTIFLNSNNTNYIKKISTEFFSKYIKYKQ